MLFSIVPMTVAAANPSQTGQRREANPMVFVTHVQDGTVVARPSVATHFLDNHTRGDETFAVRTDSPVHITVTADYLLAGRYNGSNGNIAMAVSLNNAYWLINAMTNIPAVTNATVAALVNSNTPIAYATQRFSPNGGENYFYLAAWLEGSQRNNAVFMRMVIGDENRNPVNISTHPAFNNATKLDLAQHSVYLPVEFFTRSGANYYPITITYQAMPNWPTPGTMTVSATPPQNFVLQEQTQAPEIEIEPEREPIQADPVQKTTEMRLLIDDTQHLINGIPMDGDLAPFIHSEYNHTMVPLRMVTDALDAQVDWNAETRTVTITTADGQTSQIQIDTPLPNNMGAATIVYNRTFVPINYLGSVLGLDIQWDGAARAVYINN